MTTIKNLTPHAITLRKEDGSDVVIPSEGLARMLPVPGANVPVMVDGLPVPVIATQALGPVEGLPEPVAGTVFIVSGLVLAQCAGRADVFAPATGPLDNVVRENGQIKAVTRLVAAPGITL